MSTSRGAGRAAVWLAMRAGQRRQAHHGPAGHGPAADKIGIVGGGLTGLTTAYYVAKNAPTTTKVTLYEASNRLGGWVQTDRVALDDMDMDMDMDTETTKTTKTTKTMISFERGPRTLTSLRTSPWRFDDLVLYDLAHDLDLDVVRPRDQPRFLCYRDRLVTMPDKGALRRLLHPLFLGLSGAALRFMLTRFTIGQHPRMPADDMSISHWLRSLTGSDAVADKLASGMVHGIYGGNVDELSARTVLEAAFMGLYAPKLPSSTCCVMAEREARFVRAMAQHPHVCQMARAADSSLLHFGRAGLEALPNALARALESMPNVEIKTGCRVDAIRSDAQSQQLAVAVTVTEGGSSGSSHSHHQQKQNYTHDRVIATLDAASLAATVYPTNLSSLASSPSVSIMTVNLWYPQPNLKPRGFGYLIPRHEEPTNPERALGVFFDSDVGLGGPAIGEPPGTKLFVLMGGHYYAAASKAHVAPPEPAQAVAQAKAVVERHLAIPRHTPCFAMARPAWNCIPQHTVGHADRMRAAHHELQAAFGGRLTVAGGSYSRIGVMGALRAGYDAARLMVDCATATGLERFEAGGDALAIVPKSDIAPVRRL